MIIVQLTDLHLRPLGLPAYRVAETNMLAARAVETVRGLNPAPDLIVLTGDLSDNGLPSEYAELKALIARLPAPALCILGNHDRRENFRAAFPDSAGEGPFVGFVHDAGPLRLIGLDSVTPGAGHGSLCDARLDALEAALAGRPDAPTMIFLHHPPFDCGIRHMDAISLVEGRERFRAIVAANPQVRRIACGHHHRPISTTFGGATTMIAPSVAHQVTLDLTPDGPASFCFEPPAFLVHVLRDDEIVSHQAYVERHPGPFPFLADSDYPGRKAQD